MNSNSPMHPDNDPQLSAANARAGLVLFFIYLAFYVGFMGLAAFAPQSMGRPVLFGVNLAITYGMALIVGSLVVAAVYMWACSRNAKRCGMGILPMRATDPDGRDGVIESPRDR
jgi:uncharacterized membrane protein (DUF485 family)